MLKDTVVTKPFIVVWFPSSSDITLDAKTDFEYKLDSGFYKHDNYKHEEFQTYSEADKFVDELYSEVN